MVTLDYETEEAFEDWDLLALFSFSDFCEALEVEFDETFVLISESLFPIERDLFAETELLATTVASFDALLEAFLDKVTLELALDGELEGGLYGKAYLVWFEVFFFPIKAFYWAVFAFNWAVFAFNFAILCCTSDWWALNFFSSELSVF